MAHGDPETRVVVDSTPGFAALEGRPDRVFNEAAFRYFFELERARAAQANRPLLLLLVRVPYAGRPDSDASRCLVSKTFATLTACVRDADIVGWYREGSIAAAVLMATGPSSSDTRHAVCARVVRALMKSLPADALTRVSAHIAVVGQSASV